MISLYISEQGTKVRLDGEKIVIEKQGTILKEVQLPLIDEIVIFGSVQLTTQVMQACFRKNIPILFLSCQGKYYGKASNNSPNQYRFYQIQYQLEPSRSFDTAKQIVRAKLINSRVILQRQYRRIKATEIENAIAKLKDIILQIDRVDTIDELLGLEGIGAKYYFAAFDKCIDNPDFVFHTRSRRPPQNQVNAMLSFGYTLVRNHLLHLLEAGGLDPFWGCLHQERSKYAALASDLVEEFRAPLVDALVLTLIHQHAIDPVDDFEFRDGGCYLNSRGVKKFCRAFTERMDTEIERETGKKQPRWYLLNQQITAYKNFLDRTSSQYQPYQIR